MATNTKLTNSGKPAAKSNQKSQQAPAKRRCPWCDTVVDATVAFCPECGEKLIKGAKKPKKKKKHPVLLGILLVFLGFFSLLVIAAIGSSSGRSKSSKSNKYYSSETTSKNTTSTGDSDIPMGQKWIVDGQWELTINSATETSQRNQYSELNPSAVYIIDYNYANLGYYSSLWEEDTIYFSLDGLDDSIIDNQGQMGYSYPGDVSYYPQETPIGASCHAQACVGVDNAGDFKVRITKYDGNGNKQSATMTVNVR